MKGKVVLVTGGNSGIGKATATGLAKLGAEVTLLCRDPVKAVAARKEIVYESGNPAVDFVIGNLLLQREVRKVAAEFLSTRTRLDVLVNNAGGIFPRAEKTEDGIERTMALNYFAPFLLTNLLLRTIEASAPARIVNVSSAGHYSGSLDLANINGKGGMGIGYAAYARSKLALILFTHELARRERGKDVTVNALHPGAVRTRIWASSGVFSPFGRFASMFMIGPEEGAKTPVFLASSPEVEGVTGEYFEKCAPKRSSEASYDEELAKELWDVSLKMTGLA